MRAVVAAIFFSTLFFLFSLLTANTAYAITCSQAHGYCIQNGICTGEGYPWRSVGRLDCISTKICCADRPLPTPTRTPTPTYVPNCTANGVSGVCTSSGFCIPDNGGVNNGTRQCNRGRICCTDAPTPTPTRTPTPTPTRAPCSSLFGQCWPGPRNLCIAENGDDVAATGCGGSTPICCVYNDPQTRCKAAGGQVIVASFLSRVNESDLLFPVDSVRNCYKPKIAGCSIVDRGESTTPGCNCVNTFVPTANFNYCGSGLFCRGALVVGSSVVPQSVSVTEEIPNAGDWYVNTRDGTVLVYSNPYTSNNAYLGSTRINTNDLFRYMGICSARPGTSGGGTGNPTYTVSGQVFVDTDLDGVKDTNETTGVVGVTIQRLEASPTTTNSGGNYSFTGLFGNLTYIISINNIPTGYAITKPNLQSQDIFMNNANRTINFGIAPIYSISGSVFEDTDGDRIKDAGEVNYTKGVINITSTGGAITAPSGAGTYTITNLLRGTYTVSLTPLIGYSRTPPGFSVTVGSPCSIVNPNPGASCSGNNVINLNFAIRTSGAWIQTYGFDVGIYDGYTNIVPAGSAYPPYSAVASD